MNLNLGEVSLVISVLAIVFTSITSYLTYRNSSKQKRYYELKNRYVKKTEELLTVYKDVKCLIQIEAELCNQANVTKNKARANYQINNVGPKYVDGKITDLEKELRQISSLL